MLMRFLKNSYNKLDFYCKCGIIMTCKNNFKICVFDMVSPIKFCVRKKLYLIVFDKKLIGTCSHFPVDLEGKKRIHLFIHHKLSSL